MSLKNIKILVVDDHKMIRDGIRTMLETHKKEFNFTIDEAGSGEEAINKIIILDYDIVLMDYQLPKLNGAETLQQMLIYKSTTKTLAISNYDEQAYIKNFLQAGAKGYVLKDISPTELILAINTILSGKHYFTNEIAYKLTNANSSITSKKQNHFGLTKRELQILELIVNEMTNDEIAEKLFLAKRTVDTHRQNLLNKMNVKNTVGLVKCAYEFNLVV
jgi:DNA-binding NarL/FixJ family response regulator